MPDLSTADAILEFAIQEEEAASRFYADLAARTDRPWIKTALEDFAAEEQGHKARLTAVRGGREMTTFRERIQDLQIGDYLVDLTPRPDMDYQEILVIAMKKEKAAFRMYSDFAARVTDDLRQLFLSLAQEEAKHKLRFEVEYDQHVLTEN